MPLKTIFATSPKTYFGDETRYICKKNPKYLLFLTFLSLSVLLSLEIRVLFWKYSCHLEKLITPLADGDHHFLVEQF